MKQLKQFKTLADNAQYIAQSLLFTRFDSSQRTPLTGEEAEDKDDLIDYLNSYIDKQAIQVLQEFSEVQVTDNSIAIIDDIFEEGVSIRYLVPQHHQTKASQITEVPQIESNKKTAKQNKKIALNLKNNTDSQTVFIPFRTQKARPVERLYLLVAEAQLKQGIFDDVVAMILPTAKDKNSFTVTQTKLISSNMIRIYIKSEFALPQDDPGYAYRFELNEVDSNLDSNFQNNLHSSVGNLERRLDLTNLSRQLWQRIQPGVENLPYTAQIVGKTKKYGLLTALEIYKRLPDSQKKHKAQPIASTVEKRYYTLRQVKSNTNAFRGEVDIYIHDDTAGSVWAKSLQAGSKIKVDTHYHETIKNMTVGQPLLICDETSMPTVAAMLEQWQIKTVPIVISLTNDKADFDYFNDVVLPDSLKGKLHIQHIHTAKVDNIANAVIDLIKAKDKKIDCAWGALGKKDFRPIKQYLRDEHGLKGKLNRVRAYWV